MSLTMDLLDLPAGLATRALERLPCPTVILDGEMRLRLANAVARERFEPPSSDEDPAPPFEYVLSRSGRVPTAARLRILSCCKALLNSKGASGKHDAVIAVAAGHTISFQARDLGQDRWLVVLEDRHGIADPTGIPDETQRDALTDLGNRRYLDAKLSEALAGRDPDDRPSLLLFDIDQFQGVNAHLGQNGGDALLRAVAGRLRRTTRDADQLARLDNDLFAVLQTNGLGADHLAARLVDVLGRPYLVRGEVVTIAISAGTARAGFSDIAPETFIENADLARREAKAAGGGTWRRYGQTLADRARTRQDLDADLRKALALDQMSLAYQPKVNVRTQKISGFEALSRWTHPNRGAVPPDLFIPVAEDIGIIDQLGAWALRTACEDASGWPGDLTVAVNVSGRELDDEKRFVALVRATLEETGLPARRLELELTESALVRRPEDVRACLMELHNLGVRLTLDDYGAGPVSLRQVRAVPFDTIKVDPSLTRTLDSSTESVAMVRAITTLGAGLGMTVTAEGVETRHQALMLRADGCTEIQGYLTGRPAPVSEVAAMLARDLAPIFAP